MKVSSLLDCIAETSAAALTKYWPARDENGITESNIRSAMTVVMHSLGFNCFSELPLRRSSENIRVDFTAIRDTPYGTTVVLAETKTGGGGEARVNSWIKGYLRLRSVELPKQKDKGIDPEGAEYLHLSLYLTDDKKRKDQVLDEISTNETHEVTSARNIQDLKLSDGKTYFFEQDVQWSLTLFCLSDKSDFGRLKFS